MKFNILSLSGGFVSLKILEVARVYRFDVSMTKKSNFFSLQCLCSMFWILIFIIQPNTTSNIGRCSMCRISTVIHCPWNFKTSTHVTKWFIIYKVPNIMLHQMGAKWTQIFAMPSDINQNFFPLKDEIQFYIVRWII